LAHDSTSRHAALDEATVRRLSAAFAAAPDPRGRHGRRDDLPFLLTCLVAGLLCNCTSTAAIGPWCRERRALLARSFPPQRHHTPTGATVRWLLARLPAPARACPRLPWRGRWPPGSRQPAPPRARAPVAFDGKTGRGARGAPRGAARPASALGLHAHEPGDADPGARGHQDHRDPRGPGAAAPPCRCAGAWSPPTPCTPRPPWPRS